MDQATVNVKQKDIVDAVRSVGVGPGDVIMVHSSLKSFGHVEGGPDTVVEALIEAVGPEGVVMMPTLTATYKEGSASGLVWNKMTTPSRVGAITEALRKRPDAFRSDHPTHSVAAVGKGAEELVKGHWPGSTFNIHGPFGKYVKAGGKIVFLGVFPTCNTTLHAVEDWLGLPYLQDAAVLVEGEDGSVQEIRVTGAPVGHRDFYSRKGRIHRIMEDAGAVRTVRLNETVIRMMDAKRVVGITAAAEIEFPGVLLCEDPKCGFCSEGREAIMSMRDEIRKAAEALSARGYADMP